MKYLVKQIYEIKQFLDRIGSDEGQLVGTADGNSFREDESGVSKVEATTGNHSPNDFKKQESTGAHQELKNFAEQKSNEKQKTLTKKEKKKSNLEFENNLIGEPEECSAAKEQFLNEQPSAETGKRLFTNTHTTSDIEPELLDAEAVVNDLLNQLLPSESKVSGNLANALLVESGNQVGMRSEAKASNGLQNLPQPSANQSFLFRKPEQAAKKDNEDEGRATDKITATNSVNKKAVYEKDYTIADENTIKMELSTPLHIRVNDSENKSQEHSAVSNENKEELSSLSFRVGLPGETTAEDASLACNSPLPNTAAEEAEKESTLSTRSRASNELEESRANEFCSTGTTQENQKFNQELADTLNSYNSKPYLSTKRIDNEEPEMETMKKFSPAASKSQTDSRKSEVAYASPKNTLFFYEDSRDDPVTFPFSLDNVSPLSPNYMQKEFSFDIDKVAPLPPLSLEPETTDNEYQWQKQKNLCVRDEKKNFLTRTVVVQGI